MNAFFRSVLGDQPVDSLGLTYTHEHLWVRHPSNDKGLTLDDETAMAAELRDFTAAGGRTIVEGTPIDLGRDVQALRRLSLSTGVNVIASTGHYLQAYMPASVHSSAVETLAEHFRREIEKGADGVGIRVGQIKCAVSTHSMHRSEERVLQAAARAQDRTGVPIWVHHGGILSMEILDVLERAGADLSRVVLGHADRNPDAWELVRVARRGALVSVDNLARAKQPTSASVAMIRALADHDLLDHLMLSADFGRRTYLRAFGGRPGLRYIAAEFLPRLREELGLGGSEIALVTERTPARVYGFVSGSGE